MHRYNGWYRFSYLIALAMVFLLFGCEKEVIKEGNHSPVITDLEIVEGNFEFGDTLTLKVTAEDEDEDLLSYIWSEANSLGKFITTDAATVQWVANFAVGASAIFKVEVSDGELTASASDGVVITTSDVAEFHYVGSSTCGECHAEIYEDFVDSGHPYKFNFANGDEPPTYPDFVENSRTLPLPEGAAGWGDIKGVIGGFGWKARFVDKTGHIVGTLNSTINTGGGENQYNFFGGTDWGWVDYHPADNKPYNYGCFRCHTTGATVTGEWLPGIEGTFAYGGVECEACHGQGSKHVENSGGFIDKAVGSDVNDLCGRCHYRNADHSVATSGGYIKHHEQYDEFIHTEHYDAGKTCSTCHDPHKRVIWDGDGIIAECSSCHSSVTPAAPHTSLDCTSCHMAKAAKSGVATIAGYQGDVHSHTFAIAADTSWNMFSDDGKTMRLDADGHTKLAVENVCYGCHADESGGGGTGSTKTLGELNDYIQSIH